MNEAAKYTTLEFPELLSLAMTGNREAAAEILARQEAQKQQIESLKVRASKTRAPKAESVPSPVVAAESSLPSTWIVHLLLLLPPAGISAASP